MEVAHRPWSSLPNLWSLDLLCTTAFCTLPLLLSCFVLLAWFVRAYGGQLARFLATLTRPAIDILQITIIVCSGYVTFTKCCPVAFETSSTITRGELQARQLELALERLLFQITGVVGYVFFTAVGVYATETIANQAMPESPGGLLALRPLNGSISCIHRTLTMFSAQVKPQTATKSSGSANAQSDNVDGDSDHDTADSDLTPDDESELNNYDAWRVQPASTPRRATRAKAADGSEVVICEGEEEKECEE